MKDHQPLAEQTEEDDGHLDIDDEFGSNGGESSGTDTDTGHSEPVVVTDPDGSPIGTGTFDSVTNTVTLDGSETTVVNEKSSTDDVGPGFGGSSGTDDDPGTPAPGGTDTTTTVVYQFWCNEKHDLQGNGYMEKERISEADALADQAAHLKKFPKHQDYGVMSIDK